MHDKVFQGSCSMCIKSYQKGLSLGSWTQYTYYPEVGSILLTYKCMYKTRKCYSSLIQIQLRNSAVATEWIIHYYVYDGIWYYIKEKQVNDLIFDKDSGKMNNQVTPRLQHSEMASPKTHEKRKKP